MNIVQKQQHTNNVVENVLINSGIDNIDLFLEPNSSTQSSLDSFTNLEEAAKQIIAFIATNKNITVLVDSDADGYTSSALTVNIIKDIINTFESESEVNYLVHEGKFHGLTNSVMGNIQDIDTDLLIIPDAASNDIDNLLTLSTANYNILVIDHHEIEDETYIDMIENVTVVNNQRSDNKEVSKWLTGVGMVYKVFEKVYELIETSDEKLKPLTDYLDLVSIGQIGDASDLSENEIRYLVFEGLKNIQNPFVKSVLDVKSIDTEKEIAPVDMSFSIIPIINAVTRIGTLEERKNLFESLLITDKENENTTMTKRKLNKETRKYEHVDFEVVETQKRADEIARIKSKQDSYVKKKMESLEGQTDTSKAVLLYIDDNFESEKSVSGLVATKLSRKYDKPTLVLTYDEDRNVYFGSGRGIEKVFESFKEWCNETELFNFAQGHANAFGVEIKKDNLSKLIDKISKEKTSKDFTYEVDKLYINETNKNDVDLLIKYKNIVGGKVEPITLGFKDLTVQRKNIYIKNKTVSFNVSGCSFISWGTSDEVIDAIQTGFTDSVSINMVCEPFESNFNGKKQNKLIIKDIEVDDGEESFFF